MSEPHMTSWKQRTWIWLKDIVVFILLYFAFTTFVAQGYQVPTGSMEPTIHGDSNLLRADRLLVEKFSRYFSHPFSIGDIVVFSPPASEKSTQPYVKRIVGCPGDVLEVRGGHILVNDKPSDLLEELGRQYENAGLLGAPGMKYRIPLGYYFMMGDNSGNSHDCRFFGPIAEDQIIGKVVFRYWPPARVGTVE